MMSFEEILLVVTFILQWVLLFIGSGTTKSAVEMLESQGLKIQTQKERVMLTRKCDICGAEMRMTAPRYKVTFDGWLYTEEIDICTDCFNRIAEEIKQADTPQTERSE